MPSLKIGHWTASNSILFPSAMYILFEIPSHRKKVLDNLSLIFTFQVCSVLCMELINIGLSWEDSIPRVISDLLRFERRKAFFSSSARGKFPSVRFDPALEQLIGFLARTDCFPTQSRRTMLSCWCCTLLWWSSERAASQPAQKRAGGRESQICIWIPSPPPPWQDAKI